MGVKMDDLKRLQANLAENEKQIRMFYERCAKELVARLLAKVIKRTPVGVYKKGSGKTGGTLRRGWTYSEVKQEGSNYIVEVINPVEYASYVEYGHRTRGGKGWVPGRHMMTISEKEIQKIAPALLEKRIKEALEGAFHG